jgi:hypothetical protein
VIAAVMKEESFRQQKQNFNWRFFSHFFRNDHEILVKSGDDAVNEINLRLFRAVSFLE